MQRAQRTIRLDGEFGATRHTLGRMYITTGQRQFSRGAVVASLVLHGVFVFAAGRAGFGGRDEGEAIEVAYLGDSACSALESRAQLPPPADAQDVPEPIVLAESDVPLPLLPEDLEAGPEIGPTDFSEAEVSVTWEGESLPPMAGAAVAAAPAGSQEPAPERPPSAEVREPTPYWAGIREAIQRRLRYPRVAAGEAADTNLLLRIAVDAQGGLASVEVMQGDAGSPYAEAAILAVRRAAPFGPPREGACADLPVRFRR